MVCLSVSTTSGNTYNENYGSLSSISRVKLFDGTCETNFHGKIRFRITNGVYTAIADLHDVPGKQVNVIVLSRRSTVRRSGREYPWNCRKSSIKRMMRKLEFVFIIKFALKKLVN